MKRLNKINEARAIVANAQAQITSTVWWNRLKMSKKDIQRIDGLTKKVSEAMDNLILELEAMARK